MGAGFMVEREREVIIWFEWGLKGTKWDLK